MTNAVATNNLATLVNTDDLSNQFPVSARELYKALGTKKRFNAWFDTNREMFAEGEDYEGGTSSTPQNQYGGVVELDDYFLSIDMAKQLAMLSRSENGKQVRQYFIQVEKAYNSPELMMQRGLQAANQLVLEQQAKIEELAVDAAYGAAVVKFAGCEGMTEMATILTQAGYQTGRTRLMATLRHDGYLLKSSAHWNKPSQRALAMGILRMVKTKDGRDVTVVTPKGVKYFVAKYAKAQQSTELVA